MGRWWLRRLRLEGCRPLLALGLLAQTDGWAVCRDDLDLNFLLLSELENRRPRQALPDFSQAACCLSALLRFMSVLLGPALPEVL